jgi:hypothetical protein
MMKLVGMFVMTELITLLSGDFVSLEKIVQFIFSSCHS